MRKGQDRLLNSLVRLGQNRERVVAQNKLEETMEKGTDVLFENPDENIKTMTAEWRAYLSDIKKSNDEILSELLNQRNKYDRY